MTLPQILIIDDFLGRPDNDDARREFCDEMALQQMTANCCGKEDDSAPFMAQVRFESGQVFGANGDASNDKEKALRAIAEGWPFPDGSRWALVCLDLEFIVGSGEHRETQYFGVELLSAIEESWQSKGSTAGGTCDIPVVMLSSYDPAKVERLVHRDADVAFLEKWTAGESTRFRFELGKILFKTALVPDGALRRVDQDGEIQPIPRPKPILGHSLSILRALREARLSLLRGRDARVLVMAEQGAGKELIVRFLHDYATAATAYSGGAKTQMKEQKRPWVQLNLQEIPEELISASLKGHVKGAFTGAFESVDGYLKLARGGTLHLDEIGNLGLGSLQLLLRLVENDKYLPVRAKDDETIQCQIVMTSNKPIPDMVAKGSFPGDLYDRLDKIYLPPLRERGEDKNYLFKCFVKRQTDMLKCRAKRIDDGAARRIEEYPWPGNVRQLLAVAEQVVVDREHTGSIYSKDVDRAIFHTGAELRKRWSGRYKELLNALKEFSFSPDELELAWPRLESAIGELASNMLQTAFDNSKKRDGKRVECVNRVRGPNDNGKAWDSGQCKRWLKSLQTDFSANGPAIAAMLREAEKSEAKTS